MSCRLNRGRNSDPRPERLCNDIPDNLKQLLKSLVDEHVTIILANGDEEHVEVEAVVGNMVVTSFDGCIKFLAIDCICGVEVECAEALESLLRHSTRC